MTNIQIGSSSEVSAFYISGILIPKSGSSIHFTDFNFENNYLSAITFDSIDETVAFGEL